MVCDATYVKFNDVEEELEESIHQHGFRDEREYLAFLLEVEKVWEQEHPYECKPDYRDTN